MRLPKMNTLRRIALGIPVVGMGCIIYAQLRRMQQISDSEFFREAFDILRAHEGAIHCLGEPIKQLGFRVGDPENFITTEKAQFQVNVKGPNDRGKMYLWAKPKDGVWSITRIELEINKEPERRLLIKGGPRNEAVN